MAAGDIPTQKGGALPPQLPAFRCLVLREVFIEGGRGGHSRHLVGTGEGCAGDQGSNPDGGSGSLGWASTSLAPEKERGGLINRALQIVGLLALFCLLVVGGFL